MDSESNACTGSECPQWREHQGSILRARQREPRGQQRKAQLRSIREAVVASANAGGGFSVLGVADRKRTRSDVIHGVGDLDAAGVRRDIHDGTEPHVLVEIDELQEPDRARTLRACPGAPAPTISR